MMMEPLWWERSYDDGQALWWERLYNDMMMERRSGGNDCMMTMTMAPRGSRRDGQRELENR